MSSAEEADRPDWVFGTGATPREKGLACATAAIGCVLFTAGGWDHGWAWWQWLIGLLMVWDLVGGVVANGLDTAKSFYHSPLTFPAGAVPRFLHRPVGFTAVHVQAVIAGLVFPGGPWWWGPLWYVWALVGVVVVESVSERFQRPVALAVVASGVMVSALVTAPDGLAWLPAILLLKLVLAHGVPEGAGSRRDHV